MPLVQTRFARVAIAVGEAVAMPAALSLIQRGNSSSVKASLSVFSPNVETVEGADPCKVEYYSIDNRSGNAHYPRVSRDTPHQSLSRKVDSD